MDIALLILTSVSLAVAVALGVLLLRLSRRSHERIQAGIAALSAAMDGQTHVAGADAESSDRRSRIAVGSVLDRDAGTIGGHTAIKLGVAAAMALALVVGATIEARRVGTADSGAAGVRPLELVSMRHERNGSTLSIAGIVRNPSSGVSTPKVVAVVTGFDRDGAIVATASAPLDASSIAPGEESTFAVAVPGGARVGRYRVSFRSGSQIVRHVDRRTVVASRNGM